MIAHFHGPYVIISERLLLSDKVLKYRCLAVLEQGVVIRTFQRSLTRNEAIEAIRLSDKLVKLKPIFERFTLFELTQALDSVSETLDSEGLSLISNFCEYNFHYAAFTAKLIKYDNERVHNRFNFDNSLALYEDCYGFMQFDIGLSILETDEKFGRISSLPNVDRQRFYELAYQFTKQLGLANKSYHYLKEAWKILPTIEKGKELILLAAEQKSPNEIVEVCNFLQLNDELDSEQLLYLGFAKMLLGQKTEVEDIANRLLNSKSEQSNFLGKQLTDHLHSNSVSFSASLTTLRRTSSGMRFQTCLGLGD